MATVSITANNTRVEDSESITGWSSRGGGAGASAEAPLAYQGTNTVNRKVSSTTGAGFQYDPVSDGGTARNMTNASTAHWMTKFIVSDAGGLRANDGVRIIIGDGGNEYAFITAGTDAIKNAYDEYLLRNATIICPVNPNISGYRDITHSSGTVTLTAVDQFGIEAEFATGTAKSENVGLDAIDLGTGLTLVGGDGISTDGVWQDFVDADEGTIGNRWGYANSLYGAIWFFFGQMTIGSATATQFSDNSSQILWPDGLFANGFSRAFCDIQNASTTINDGSTHTSLGTTNVEDTRADFVWSGTSGTGTASHTLNNFRNYVMTSAVTLDGANIEIADLTHGSGNITNSTIRCNSASGVAISNDIDFTKIDKTNFVQRGSGHAIEITTPGTYSLDALTFTGFGIDGSLSAAIYNNSGGAVTLNIINGGSTPTVRNSISSTLTINNTVPVKVTVLDASTGNPIQGARVLLEADAGGVLPAGTDILAGLTDTNGVIEDTGFNFILSQPVIGKARKASSSPYYKTGTILGTITNSGLDTTVLLLSDE